MANQPDIIPSAWAANNSTTETIPATTTESGKASWDQGFPVETSLPLSQGGIPPKYGDFNGILNVLSQFCLFAQSGGQYAWVNSMDYSVGSIVLGTDGSIYRAAQVSGPSTTAVNPVGDTSGKWERIVSKSDIDALEEDIQDAMDVASDAASNASAAQSAVTTLDANVVKLAGVQAISGAKTFNDNVTIGLVNPRLFLNSTDTGVNAEIHFQKNGVDTGGVALAANDSVLISTKSGSAYWYQGACLTLQNNGYFDLRAKESSTGTSLIGTPNGTLTWGGKGFVYTSGKQELTGSVQITNSQPRIDLVENDVEDHVTGSGWQGMFFHDKNSTEVGGVVFIVGSTENTLAFRVKVNGTADTPSIAYRNPISTGTPAFCPYGNNNRINLGQGGNLWKQVFAGTTTISTSDERLKSNISAIPDDVLDAWEDVQWSQYQFNDAVAEKGKNARIHNGLVAQRIDAIFSEHGIDVSKYGFFCHDEWTSQEEQKDDNGNIIAHAQEAGDAYALRYEEALCVEAAYQRRRAYRAEARITSLEQRLGEMEAVLASLISPISEEQTAEPEEPVVEETPEQEGEGADA